MKERSGILLVDDDELIQEMLRANLEGSYQVEAVNSGQAALDLLEKRPFDLVLLDVDMPGMNGYATCQQLRSSAAAGQTPVIFLSACSTIEERLQGYAAGGDDYVSKPFDPPELLAKIERLLMQRSRQLELGAQLDEAMGAVLSSADMVGEVGVVLDMQRKLAACKTFEDVAHAMFDALAAYGLDGSLRIRSRNQTLSVNGKGPCTALEASILDHMQGQSGDPRIRPLGVHTSFNFGATLLFVRDLPMNRSADMDPATAERHGRAIDNVALLLEGACARVAALDSEVAVRDLDSIKHLVMMTREALSDIKQRNQEQTADVRGLFEKLVEDVEHSYLHLGLTNSQEEFLSGLIKQYKEAVMTSLGKSSEVEQFLEKVIRKLTQYA